MKKPDKNQVYIKSAICNYYFVSLNKINSYQFCQCPRYSEQ